jgi:hypothetical protein
MRKTLFLNVILILTAFTSFKHMQASDIETKVAEEVVKAVAAESAQALLGATNCLGLAAEVYQTGKGIHSYFNPSADEQAKAQMIENQLRLVTLRKEFRTCLLNHRSARPGRLGIPSVCQEKAEILGLAGGHEDANRMIEVFKMFGK